MSIFTDRKTNGMETTYGFTYSKKEMTKIVKGFTSRGVFYKPRFTDDWEIKTVEEKGKYYVYLSSRKLKVNFKYGDAGKFYHNELMSRKIQVKSNANMFSDIKGEYALTSEGLMERHRYEKIFNKWFQVLNPKFEYLKYQKGKFYQDSFGRYIYTVSLDELQGGKIDDNQFIRKNCCLTNSALVIDFTTDEDISIKTLDREIHPNFIKEIPLTDYLLKIIMIKISNLIYSNILIDINNPKDNRLVKSGRRGSFREYILLYKDDFYYATDFFRLSKNKNFKTIEYEKHCSKSCFKIDDIDKFIKNPFKVKFDTSTEHLVSSLAEHWKLIPNVV